MARKNLTEFPATKVCSGPCGRELPRDAEHFEPCAARTADGMRGTCRDCVRKRDREYRARARAQKKAEKEATQ